MTERGLLTRSNVRRLQRVRVTDTACARFGGLRAAFWLWCVAADTTVRAPGIGCDDGARVVNPQQRPKAPEGSSDRHGVRAFWWAEGRVLAFVRCCGQDCPRAGNWLR